MLHRQPYLCNTLKLSIMTLLLLAIPTITFADKQQQLINDVFELSGVNTLFVQLPILIESTFNQMESHNVDVRIGEVKQAMTQAFTPKQLRSNAVDYINDQLTINQLEQIHKHLSSPLARKITALENAANKADSVAKMMRYAQRLQKNPPEDSRIELIAELINASNAVESSLTVRIEFFRGFMEAASLLDPVEERMSKQQIDKQIFMLRAQMEENTAQEVILAFLFTYQSLNDNELRNYISIYQQKSMLKFTTEINKAIAYSFRAAGKKMMREMSSKLRIS